MSKDISLNAKKTSFVTQSKSLEVPFFLTSYKGDKIIIEKEFLNQELINEKIQRTK